MPLASDRSASLHRAAKLEEEKKAEARRRRLSLPKSIRSSTNVNETKAERRKSRRLSERLSISKENHGSNVPNSPRLGPTPYHKVVEERGGQASPRLTRSNQKAKKPPTLRESLRRNSSSHGVLSFSPPNQEMNALREQERNEAIERSR